MTLGMKKPSHVPFPAGRGRVRRSASQIFSVEGDIPLDDLIDLLQGDPLPARHVFA
jgi:hypothetical protein